MNEREADFILKGEEVIYPKMPKGGLELYYDVRGKTNADARRNVILDMSGKGRNGSLSGFTFDEQTGYHDGLVFDGRDDTLTRAAVAGLDPNNLTFQVNSNILRFKPDGTSQTVWDAYVNEIGRNLIPNSQIERQTTRFYELRIYDQVKDMVGETVTFSFDMRTNTGGILRGISFYAYQSNGVTIQSSGTVVNSQFDKWERFSKTTTIVQAGTNSSYTPGGIGFYDYLGNNNYTLRNFKLERGNIATPWTPAPEDIVANLSLKNNILGDLENVIDDMDLNTITDTSVTISDVKDNHIDVTVSGNTVQQSDWYAKVGESTQVQTVQGKNLFDKSTMTDNYYYTTGTDGAISNYKADSRFFLSDYIKCEFGKSYVINRPSSNSNQVFFDKDRVLVRYVSSTDVVANIITPEDGEFYFRTYCNKTEGVTPDSFQVEEGSTPTSYTPFVPNSPSPDYPSPITSNLPSGTYKYTSTDGIYEFTLDEELRGIGASVDRIVFDRTSKTGKLERKLGRKIINGSETFSNYSAGMTEELSTFSVNINLSALGYATSWSSHFKNVNGGWDYPISEHYSDHPSNTLKYLSIFNRVIGAVSSDTYTVRNDKFKSWLSTNNVTFIYRLANPTTTAPITFTKVTSSTKTEVPMTFFTATPSLEYPAQVWDVEGKVVSRGRNLFDQNRSIELFGQDTSAGYGGTSCTKILRGYRIRKRWSAFGFWHHLTPNTAYTLSAKVSFSSTDSGQKVGIVVNGYIYSPYSEKYSRLFDGSDVNGTRISLTFISSATSAINNIGFMSNSSDSTTDWTVDITDICLQLGGSSVYDEYVAEQYTLPTLRKIGTVADTYNPVTGVLTKRISDWVKFTDSVVSSKTFNTSEYSSTALDIKRIECSDLFSNANSYTNLLVIQPDSTPMVTTFSAQTSVANTAYNITGSTRFMLTNDRTGFGGAYMAENAEVRAYFYGWKMCNADGTSPYYKSEVPYNPTTWAEWTKEGSTVVADSSGASMSGGTGATQYINFNTPIKNSTKYGFLYNVVSSNTSANFGIAESGLSFPETYFGKTVGNNKITLTSLSTVIGNRYRMYLSGLAVAGESIKFKDFRVFELPTGSQIEADFTNLTADQLAAKYTFNGLCVKNWKKVTDGTGRTATLPTASYEGYTPYKMIYQLATPVTSYLAPVEVPTYYPTTVIETDAPDYCKPMLTATVKALDYLKENRTVNNILLWSRALSDAEMIRQYKLFHERYRMKSATVDGVPIEGFVWIEGGAYVGSTMSEDMTITI